MQLAASLANQYILPKPPGAETRSAHLDPLIPGESQED
jgi:hypothetical protein